MINLHIIAHFSPVVVPSQTDIGQTKRTKRQIE